MKWGKKFKIEVYDTWNESYTEKDVRELLKDELNLNVVDAALYDNIIFLLSSGNANKIYIKE